MTADPIHCLGFVAPSGTGKTTLLRGLVPRLRARGLRVGYLKHAHHGFDLDTPGKDSYELRAAGAGQVLIASDTRWALLTEHPDRAPAFPDLLARFDARTLDLVLVEGFQAGHHPRIALYRAAVGGAPPAPGDPELLAIASDVRLPGDGYPPWLPLHDHDAIAEFVLSWLAGRRVADSAR